jgi:hypothetical protein
MLFCPRLFCVAVFTLVMKVFLECGTAFWDRVRPGGKHSVAGCGSPRPVGRDLGEVEGSLWGENRRGGIDYSTRTPLHRVLADALRCHPCKADSKQGL